MAQEVGDHQNGAASVTETAAAKGPIVGFKPQLAVPATRAEAAVQFYKLAFAAEEVHRLLHSKRKADQEIPLILSAELLIGSSSLIVSELFDEAGSETAAMCGGVTFQLEVEDVDAAVKKAVAAGAELVGDVAGDDGGVVRKVKDPFGVTWAVASATKKAMAQAEDVA